MFECDEWSERGEVALSSERGEVASEAVEGEVKSGGTVKVSGAVVGGTGKIPGPYAKPCAE